MIFKKDCEFCRKTEIRKVIEFSNPNTAECDVTSVEFGMYGEKLTSTIYVAGENIPVGIISNYCPMCGRRLRKKLFNHFEVEC